MKAYRVKIVQTLTMWVEENEFKEDDVLGQEFNEFTAIDFAKKTLIHKMENNPNRGSVKVIGMYDYETNSYVEY
jgi:hypothetical protein